MQCKILIDTLFVGSYYGISCNLGWHLWTVAGAPAILMICFYVGLYIGGLGALRSLPFTYVLTVMADSIAEYKPQDSCTSRLVIPVYDTEDSGLLEHFPQAIAFIEQGLEAGAKVLVHCAAGVSRSATVPPASF